MSKAFEVNTIQVIKDIILSKRKRNILITIVVLLLLVFLAVVLPGKAKALFFGLLIMVGFIALFGALTLLMNYLNEVVVPRPRKPTHLCHHCLALYQDPEEENCEFCQAEFGFIHPLYPLPEFLENNSQGDIQERLDELHEKRKTARGRNIIYIEHDMKMARRLLRMKQPKNIM